MTDGEERAIVGTTRCLARAGYRVSVAATQPRAPAQWSRMCARRLTVPDPRADAARFVDALADALATDPHELLLPGSDAALMAISEHRDRLEPLVRLGLPPREVVLACVDKQRLAAAAVGAGLATPETRECHTLEQARAAAAELGYPLVIKPVRSVFVEDGRVHQRGGRSVADERELAEALPHYGHPCLLQRSEPGMLHSCSGVMTPDGLVAVGTSRYDRTWPPTSGNAAHATMVASPAGLAERVEALLAALGWFGLFELELIRRPDDGMVAIDLNPRPFGSIALPIAAGAPLPAIWCAWLDGERPALVEARVGLRYRWEDGDLRNALWQLRHGRQADARRALAPGRRTVYAHFRSDDPGPLLARSLYLASAGLTRNRTGKSP